MAPEPRRDLGLAGERTRLAWARTAIAFAAVGAALLKKEVAVGLLVLAAAPLVFTAGHLAGRGTPPQRRARRLLVVTITVTAVAVLAAIAAFLGHGPDSLRQLFPRHG
jgi:uncharacterized membrane protein YidH (DUF202 family)